MSVRPLLGAVSKNDPLASAAARLGCLEVQEGIAKYFPDLLRRARKLTGDGSRADDLVQDTVERALRFQDSFQMGGYVRAWLFRIMQNVFISQRRRAATERRVLEGAGVDPNGWATLEPALMAPGLSPPVERALTQLPDHLRSVVTLVDLGESSYKDAARVEDVPVGTIMSRLSRGRARLAAQLSSPQAA
jgi:RNA polymerase sigma-70 factor (ECF subfamily)